IDTQYEPSLGQLRLTCFDEETFARLRDLVIAEAGVADAFDDPVDRVNTLLLTNETPAPADSWLRDRVALLGCALVALMLLFVFAMGLVMIGGWFLYRPASARSSGCAKGELNDPLGSWKSSRSRRRGPRQPGQYRGRDGQRPRAAIQTRL